MTGGNWGQMICKSPFFPVDTALCKWLVLNLYEVLLKVSTLDQDLNPHEEDLNWTKTHVTWFQDLMKLSSWCLITERIQWEMKW